MTLQAYRTEKGLSRADFAKLLGVKVETIRRYEIGERIPDKPIMQKIALATRCQVTANDFFGIA